MKVITLHDSLVDIIKHLKVSIEIFQVNFLSRYLDKHSPMLVFAKPLHDNSSYSKLTFTNGKKASLL